MDWKLEIAPSNFELTLISSFNQQKHKGYHSLPFTSEQTTNSLSFAIVNVKFTRIYHHIVFSLIFSTINHIFVNFRSINVSSPPLLVLCDDSRENCEMRTDVGSNLRISKLLKIINATNSRCNIANAIHNE